MLLFVLVVIDDHPSHPLVFKHPACSFGDMLGTLARLNFQQILCSVIVQSLVLDYSKSDLVTYLERKTYEIRRSEMADFTISYRRSDTGIKGYK